MTGINMAEAKSRFSEFVSRAASGERFVILKRERPLAAIIGADELASLEHVAEMARRLAQALGQSEQLLDGVRSGRVHPAMAAFGLWKDEDDLSGLMEEVKRCRQRPSSRPRADL